MRNDHNFKILLKNKANNLLDLSYTLIQNPSAQIWFKCLKGATEKSSINSTRFYHGKSGSEFRKNNFRIGSVSARPDLTEKYEIETTAKTKP